jgi:signal transduction histidine kinase
MSENHSQDLLKINFDIVSVFLDYTDWYDALAKVFSLVGRCVDVDRIYYFENHRNPISGEELTSQRYEWVKQGIAPMIDNPELQNLPIEFVADFMEPLLKDRPFESIVSQLPAGNTKDILASQGIRSILVLPLFIDKQLFGFIGFDDCIRERNWTLQELHFLKSITSNLASAIFRRNAMKEVERKVDDLERINRELEQFAYVASHDLQEPLRMVTEFLKLLEKKYAPVLDETGRSYIRYAVGGSVRMKGIISDLLEYSRVGRTSYALEPVNCTELVDEIRELLGVKIAEKSAVVSLQHPAVVLTWKTPLRQVLLNLVDNSLKYARAETPPVVELAVRELEKYWLFSCTDNGIGIAPEYHEKIFVIFQRLHTKDEYEGTGIGLAISKKIIENLGGKIWLESVPGEKTTFYFTIPKKQA